MQAPLGAPQSKEASRALRWVRRPLRPVPAAGAPSGPARNICHCYIDGPPGPRCPARPPASSTPPALPCYRTSLTPSRRHACAPSCPAPRAPSCPAERILNLVGGGLVAPPCPPPRAAPAPCPPPRRPAPPAPCPPPRRPAPPAPCPPGAPPAPCIGLVSARLRWAPGATPVPYAAPRRPPRRPAGAGTPGAWRLAPHSASITVPLPRRAARPAQCLSAVLD